MKPPYVRLGTLVYLLSMAVGLAFHAGGYSKVVSVGAEWATFSVVLVWLTWPAMRPGSDT